MFSSIPMFLSPLVSQSWILTERQKGFSSLSEGCGFFFFLEHPSLVIACVSCRCSHLWHGVHGHVGFLHSSIIFNPSCQNIEYFLQILVVFLKIKPLDLIYWGVWFPFHFSSPTVWKTFLCSFSSNIISLIKFKFSSLILLAALKALSKISPCV